MKSAGLSRRQWLTSVAPAGALSLWLGPQRQAYAARITGVRIWPSKDYTRVTIESDRALRSRAFFTSHPPHLAIDIEGLDTLPNLRTLTAQLQASDPNVARLRVAQNPDSSVRLLVELKQHIDPQIFQLPPVARYQHRLVLDLHAAPSPDPLQELIAQRLNNVENVLAAGPNSPALPPSDPLGELIRQQGPDRAVGKTAVARAATTSVAVLSPTQPVTAVNPMPTLANPTRNPNPALGIGLKPASLPPAVPPPATSPPPKQAAAPPTGPKATPRQTDRLIVVALDPGHGGEDPGAIGPGGTQEKHVVLQIAQRLRQRLSNLSINGNPVQVYMTRDADFFVPLPTRVEKARRVQADLFVSLHADAFDSPVPQGISVYALSHNSASSATASWIAKRENAADLVGGVNLARQRDTDASVQRILFDMSTTAQINDSLKLGHAMLGEMGRVGKLHKAKVEQAGFAVLKAPDIPSVLVETAFISNPEEEKRLNDPAYQDELADALLRGIKRYFANNPPLARSRQL